MPAFARDIVIDRPAEEVFALMTAPERMPEWIPYVRKCEYVGGGPMHEGTRLNIFMGERRTRLQQNRVSAFEPPRLFALTAHHLGAVATYAWRLEPLGPQATRVTLEVDCAGPWWMRPLTLIAGKAMEAIDGTMLEWLKRAAETDARTREPAPGR